jgi:hypothetical protein
MKKPAVARQKPVAKYKKPAMAEQAPMLADLPLSPDCGFPYLPAAGTDEWCTMMDTIRIYRLATNASLFDALTLANTNRMHGLTWP